MQDFIRVVQITDTHLFADPAQTLLGLNTQDSFMAVLQDVQALPWRADMLLLTGDLAQDESAEAYQRLAQQIDKLNTPVYWLPGNHDNFERMMANLHGTNLHNNRSIIKHNWQLILLNSQIPGKVPGMLAQSQLQFLENRLKEYPLHHVMICFHHPPVVVGSKWIDSQHVKNAMELFEIMDRYPQMKCILTGHVHQDFFSRYNNVPIYTTPSTSIQFKPKVEQFALDIIPPGYRILELNKDGSINTQVVRVTQFRDYIKVDPQAKGY